MSFFSKIKDTLGIGGVKIMLQLSPQHPKTDGVINGKINFSTKSEKTIQSFQVILIEEYVTGRGDNKQTKEFELGSLVKNQAFEIKPGDSIEISFDLPYNTIKSNNDSLKEKGGALGALGKMASFADNEKSRYFIKAIADVKGVDLDPDDKKEIHLV
ncbi:MAG: sporulation protein [Bacteroidetes bacterium]|nr:sporulation protein [Bacteroidota bacterium]HET6245420.1 sporulation protein [Bacteroidia bacterium]